MEYQEFLERIKEIKEIGFVQSHRSGPTGIGKTLEDLLGIIENNIAGPDFSTYELKAARKDSESMLTLFAKAPQPKSANRKLLEAYGYIPNNSDVKSKQLTLNGKEAVIPMVSVKEKELHVTLDAIKSNSVGLKLGIAADKLFIENDKRIEAYWDNNTLKATFERKHHRLIYVLAERKKEKGKELFWYNEAYLLDGFSFNRFSRLVEDGVLKVDIRIGHYSDGSPHDHGTAFRIMPKYLPQCFSKIIKIL